MLSVCLRRKRLLFLGSGGASGFEAMLLGLGLVSGGFFTCVLGESSAAPVTSCSPAASLESCLVNLFAIFFTFPCMEPPPTGEGEVLCSSPGGISGFGLTSGLRSDAGHSWTDIAADGCFLFQERVRGLGCVGISSSPDERKKEHLMSVLSNFLQQGNKRLITQQHQDIILDSDFEL